MKAVQIRESSGSAGRLCWHWLASRCFLQHSADTGGRQDGRALIRQRMCRWELGRVRGSGWRALLVLVNQRPASASTQSIKFNN